MSKRNIVSLDDRGGEGKTVCLTSTLRAPEGGFSAEDLDKGLFRNVSIITRGPANGHGMWVDDVTLEQVAEKMLARGGVKSHFTHTSPPGIFTDGVDGIERLIGSCAGNVRIEDGQVRGDLQLGEFAKDSPIGNVWKFLTGIAKSMPKEIGLSIRFHQDEPEERFDEGGARLDPAFRILDVVAVDFVGDPAANPGGLLQEGPNAKTTTSHGRPVKLEYGDTTMNKALRRFLESKGLDANSDEKAALAYFEALSEKDKVVALAIKDAVETTAAELNAEKDLAVAQALKTAGDSPAGQTPEQLEAKARTDHAAEIKELRGIAKQAGITDPVWADKHFTAKTPMKEVQAEALAHLAKSHGGKAVDGGQVVTGGTDLNLSTLGPAIGDAILQRCRVPLVELNAAGEIVRDDNGRVKLRKAHDRAVEFRSRSLIETGRIWLASIGVPGVGSMTRGRVAELALNARRLRSTFGGIALQSTGDFPLILEDVMNKSLRAAYVEANPTWERWARRVTNVDFKEIKRLALSESPDVVVRAEGAGLTYVTLTESRETYVLVEYANGIRFTRHAMINDDLDAFGRTPRLQAGAARRKEDDVTYAVLTDNAAMADGNALFSVAHNNVAILEGVPSVATLNAARAAMRTQTGIGGDAILNIVPVYLLAPAEQEGTVRELLNSTANPASNNANVENIWRNNLEAVIEPRLDAVSRTAWYLEANTDQIDTIEVCFLEGEELPVSKSETEFDTDDMKFSVRHTVAAHAIDHRGQYRNGGGG